MRCTSPEELQYFVINTPDKWREGLSDSVFINREGQLSLTPMLDIDPLGQISHARGLAVDGKGDLFVIDAENCHIWQSSTESQTLERLECFESCESKKIRLACSGAYGQGLQARSLFGCGSETGEFKFKDIEPPCEQAVFSGGLAFGKETLYVADTFNHRVQAFYLPQFQIRLVLGKQGNCGPESGTGDGEFNQPKDIAIDSRGDVYVLDYGNQRVQKFNRCGKFLRVFGASGSHVLKNPESIAIDQTDSVYVVDSKEATVEKFDRNGEWQSTPVRFREISQDTEPSAVAVDENGIIYVGEKGKRPDLSIHEFDQNNNYLGHFGKYSGECFKLVVDRKGRRYASCGTEGEVILFDGDGQFEKQGTYYSRVFDSTIEACQWHRFALHIQPVEKSAIVFSFRASDELFVRDAKEEKKLGWRPLFNTPSNSVAVSDALFPKAPGRYVQLKFQLSGDGFHSHTVREAQIYFQRISYLRYLPSAYQEDEEGRDFLERFLSIFESLSFEVEREITGVAKYFDPQAVTGEFLDWLGTWIALLRDNNWPEGKRRELLKRAFRLYGLRGTMQGLQELIELFAEGETVIIEHHRLRTPMVLSVNSTLGASTIVGRGSTKRLVLEESSRIGGFALIESDEPPEKPFEASAFDFTILADTSRLKSDAQMQALRRLIEEEKPAHTRCVLRASGNVMQLGMHALLGIDTKLSRGFEPARLGLTSQIGKGTFLGTKFRRRGVIGVRSAIAADAVLH